MIAVWEGAGASSVGRDGKLGTDLSVGGLRGGTDTGWPCAGRAAAGVAGLDVAGMAGLGGAPSPGLGGAAVPAAAVGCGAFDSPDAGAPPPPGGGTPAR